MIQAKTKGLPAGVRDPTRKVCNVTLASLPSNIGKEARSRRTHNDTVVRLDSAVSSIAGSGPQSYLALWSGTERAAGQVER